MKNILIVLAFALLSASCSQRSEDTVQPAKEPSKTTTLSSDPIPEFDHVSANLLATGYQEIARPVYFSDPNGFTNYKKITFFINPSDPIDLWIVYGWNHDFMPGSQNNPTPAVCSKVYSETPNLDGSISMSCTGEGSTCDTEVVYNTEGKVIRATIIKCQIV